MATILAIDDDPDILVIVGQTLRSAGHHVLTTSDPATAPALAAEHRVDAIVLDIQMPDLSGYEVLQALRGQPLTGGVPILFLSALSDSTHRIRGLREGADDFLDKPFAPEELTLRLDRLLNQRPRGIVAKSSQPSESQLSEAGSMTPTRLALADVGPSDLGIDKVSSKQVSSDQVSSDQVSSDQVFMGRYEVQEVVGKGAMGVVFRGWDPRLRRPVALKTLRFDHLASDEDRGLYISRLLDEAITVARFSDPNIVAVYDVDEGARGAFIAMEFVDGTSLEDFLAKQSQLPPSQVIALGIGISRGLAAAHSEGIVHRDVKPGNILLGVDGSIKVTDFGVALLMTSLASAEGKIFGTPGYLPPETLMSEGYSEAGDLFGLGVILYQCLTGERAFRGANIHQRMLSTLNDVVIPPEAMIPDVPEELDQLVLDLLEKRPEDRLSSAREVASRLSAVGDGEWTWEPPPGSLTHRGDSKSVTAESVLVEPFES